MLWLLFGFGCESTDKDRDGFSIFENDCDDNDYYVNPLMRYAMALTMIVTVKSMVNMLVVVRYLC